MTSFETGFKHQSALLLILQESAALPLYNALPNVTTKIAGGSGVVVATGTEAV